MQLHWQSKSLPTSGQMLGHGVCIYTEGTIPGKSELVAHVEDFGWLHRGEDTIIWFDPQRLPDGPVRESFRTAVEDFVRARKRRWEGEIAPGIYFHLNG